MLLSIFVVSAGLSGCSTAPPEIDKTGEAQRLQAATSARDIFNKVHGDWNSLSEADKEAFTKMAGSDLKAKASWAGMKDGPGAAAEVMRKGGG